jgi:hypothetical protein
MVRQPAELLEKLRQAPEIPARPKRILDRVNLPWLGKA